MPWRLVFLLGSGFAISRASIVSGLAVRLGQGLVPLKELPPVLMLALVLVFVSTMTEFTSNVGTANILLPVVAHMVSVNAPTMYSLNTLRSFIKLNKIFHFLRVYVKEIDTRSIHRLMLT